MEALVEVHTEDELRRALDAGATLVGVNNRDLRTFKVSLEVSLALGRRLPAGVTAVSESGISSQEDIRRLAEAGYRGFLVGGSLMRASVPGAALAGLLGSRVPQRKAS
jgi:indole-3-glycerol phosphate synthase